MFVGASAEAGEENGVPKHHPPPPAISLCYLRRAPKLPSVCGTGRAGKHGHGCIIARMHQHLHNMIFIVVGIHNLYEGRTVSWRPFLLYLPRRVIFVKTEMYTSHRRNTVSITECVLRVRFVLCSQHSPGDSSSWGGRGTSTGGRISCVHSRVTKMPERAVCLNVSPFIRLSCCMLQKEVCQLAFWKWLAAVKSSDIWLLVQCLNPD